MSRFLIVFAASAAFLTGSVLHSQEAPADQTRHPEDMQSPPDLLFDKDAPAPANATKITASKEATFNARERLATFSGEVRVTDPQFNLTCDNLTVVLGKDNTGMEEAQAEGHVLIVQDKPSEDGGKPTRSVGRARKAVYNPKSGDVTLTGSPEVQQGINVHRATESSTVMVLNRDGRLKTLGQSVTLIQDREKEAKN